MSVSTLRIGVLMPEVLGTYGDTGNALILAERARRRGIDAEVVHVGLTEEIPDSLDIYTLGGGEDTAQALAADKFRATSGLSRALDAGRPLLAICASLQVLGHWYEDARGARVPGMGVLDITTEPQGHRTIGELVTVPLVEGLTQALSGFENHGGGTVLGPDAAPLGRVVSGVGNGTPQGRQPADVAYDGAVQGSIIATYMHGPALPPLAVGRLRSARGSATSQWSRNPVQRGGRVVMLKQMSHQEGTLMSNPSPYDSQGGQNTPWPQYGENAQTAAPQGYSGAAYGGGYAGPTAVVMPDMPSRAPGVVTLVIGVLLMIIVAPIVLIMTMGMGITSAAESVGNEAILRNGDSVTVTSEGQYTLMIGEAGATSCSLVDSSGVSHRMQSYDDQNNLYTASNLSSGTYKIDCDLVTSGTDIFGFNGNAEDAVIQMFVMPFVWATVVGVIGLILLIVGIVLLVKANGKRRRLVQQTMMSAIR